MNYLDTSGMCYSNLVAYGAGGRVNPIINPHPATIVPQLFRLQKPHPFMPQLSNPIGTPSGLGTTNRYGGPRDGVYQCNGYKMMGQ